jgi:hypothetical protein
MRSTRWLPALVIALSLTVVAVATPFAAPASIAATGWRCTTSAAHGSCGPFDRYSAVTGTTSGTRIGNNVWAPITGWRQTLRANSLGDWQVTATMPDGNTAVVSYPSIGANYGRVTNVPTPLRRFSMIRSRFTEHMHPTASTSAWAAYDIWLGRTGCSDCPSHEVMIQHDFANNGACATAARVSFRGSGGVLQRWHLCKYGSELIWKLGRDEAHKVNEHSGAVPILAMLRWLVRHHDLPARTGLWLIGYGWEICSTGGQRETFKVSRFSLRARLRH